MATSSGLTRAENALRRHALTYPESTEEFPWGERAIKVKGKVFLFMSVLDGLLRLSVKLPVSGAAALGLPFASPTGYGLGKSGWVSACFGQRDNVPLDLLREWVDESFRAVAPKRVLAQLEDAESADADAPAPKRGKKRGARERR
jgi:predicted DNA-binding protein (MmcQ/YjbR family)